MVNKITVLIAEDDENDRFLIQRAFAKADTGLCITFAGDGEETINYLQQFNPFAGPLQTQPPDLLLLDLKMPRLDGFQVLEWFAEYPAHRPARVVVLSSSSDPIDIERARKLGADSYHVKPHDHAEYVLIAQGLTRPLSSTAKLRPALTIPPQLTPLATTAAQQ